MNLADLSKQELIELIKSYQATKKYGIVWDTGIDKEKVALLLQGFLPILKINSKKTINCSPDQVRPHHLIEGDNFLALKLMEYSHAKSIDVIYIDPPYNTGNKDFKYNDRFIDKEDPYRHSSWLNFINKRLVLAKKLLKDDGVIFISIDDNEMPQLKMLCDEIFGEKNFIATFVWEKKRKASNLDATVRGITEYVLAYGSKMDRALIHPFDKVEENKPYPFYNTGNKRSELHFPAGIAFSGLADGNYGKQDFKAKKTLVTLLDNVEIKNGRNQNEFRLEGEWRYSQKWLDWSIRQNEEIVFKGKDFKPYWINKSEDRNKKMKTLLNFDNYQIGTNEDGNEELFQIIGENSFDFPKPISLIKALLSATTNARENCTVLDFFAGTGTTGAAVLEMNAEDEGNRQFILVTNNENEICTGITYPRIKRSIEGYKNQKGIETEPLGGNLVYSQISFVQKTKSSDEMTVNYAENSIDLICLKENVYIEIEKKSDIYHVFSSPEKIVGIYLSFDLEHLEEMKKSINKHQGEKELVAYIFSFDAEGISENSLWNWKPIRLESLPAKMLEIIGETND